MGLVDNQCIVFAEEAVVLNLCQQYAVGHQFDGGFGRALVRKAHLVAHGLAQGGFQFVGNTVSHGAGCYTPGLGMANYTIDTTPGLQANFGQLGGFTRAGFTGHYYHLVVANQLDYFL